MIKTIQHFKLYSLIAICTFFVANFSAFGQNYNMSNTTINGCSGTFYDPGGNANYANGLGLITMTFCSDQAGDEIVLDFSGLPFQVETGWDFLNIYDGVGTGGTQLWDSQASGGATNPGVITSTTGCVTVTFSSDGSLNYSGWEAAISCITPAAPTCSDGIQNQGEAGIDCGGPCPACTDIIMAPGTINACAGTFYDPGGTGDYAAGENVEMTICSSTPGEVVEINFTTFTVENGFDDLFIYDGPSTGSPLVAGSPFTGANAPGTITSSSGCLTFVFTSDGSVQQAGWIATISCVVPPIPTCNDGIQNQGEIDIDCGGPCPACVGVYISQEGTINTCDDVFYDSGGTGVYGANEDLTITICPDVPGQAVVLDFTMFDVEGTTAGDVFCVYDGLDILAPTFGCYTNDSPLTGIVQAANPTGCVTFWFQSTGSIQLDGWEAAISCATLCQDVIASAIMTPVPDPDGIVRICPGDAVQFNGAGAYPQNGIGYVQSDGTSTFTWDMGDGTTQVGQIANQTYPTEGGFIIQLEIEDIEGCSNTNDIDQLVYVSTTPIFAGSIGAPDPICLGDQATMTGVVTPVTYEQICTPPTFPPLSLPDGSGVSYQTNVNLDCYLPGQTLTDVNDLLDICVNMEHSYMGDLDIVIECPDGTQVTLVDYPNGGGTTFLGVPVDVDATPLVQGTGWQYCWSPTATNGAWSDNTGGTLPAGTYESTDPLAGLVGCPMNGDWTIIITDNLASDNGFIFDWSINFNPAIISTSTFFTPVIVNEYWLADPTIVSGTNPIVVEPTSAGVACYIFEVEDDFGCFWDTTVCITVDPSPVIDPIADITSCADVTLPNITGVDLTGNQAFFTGPLGTGTQYNPGDVITGPITLTLYIFDEMLVAPFCDDEESFIVTVTPLDIDAGPDQVYCPLGAAVTIGADPVTTVEGADYSWSPTGGNGTIDLSGGGQDHGQATVSPAVTTTYTLTVSVPGCVLTEDVIVTIDLPPTASDPAPIVVACPSDVPPADPAVVIDENDDITIPPAVTLFSENSNGASCPEVITRVYRVTDACGNFVDVTQLITIMLNTGPVMPPNGSSTVNCLALAVQPAAPAVDDQCGNDITPVITENGDPACEGDKVYTYTYTDCGGNVGVYTYTYTIDMTTPLTPPANGTSTVLCPANASDPGAPADILDGCGNTVSAVFVSSDPIPACEGDVVWTYSYTDCALNTVNWTHTYTIDMTTPLAPPALGASNVTCPTDATDPGAPADITDGCGNTVSAVLVGSVDAPNPIVCVGTRVWTYSYTDCAGNTVNWTHTYTIDNTAAIVPPGNTVSTVLCPANATDPGAPANVIDPCGATIIPVLIGSSAVPACEGDVVWTYQYTDCSGNTYDWTHTYTIDMTTALTAPALGTSTVNCPANASDPGAPADILDGCGNTVSAVLVGSDPIPACEGDVVWTYSYTDCAGNTVNWTHTYTIDMTTPLAPPALGSSTVTCLTDATDPGAPADILDGCGNTVSAVLVGSVDAPNPIVCAGTRVWTYSYTDCAGNTVNWTYTYTIDNTAAIVPPGNTVSTVLCPANATDPGAPANIIDPCGATIIPVLIGSSAVPACEGDVVWTYQYTDCSGNTYDWTHTYTIDMTTALTAPANGTSTVLCPANASDPGAPADILDGCGNTVSAVLVGSDPLPACEGDVVWTYIYTDCAGNTVNWTHTYTIDMTTPLTPPALGTSTVNCPANASDPGAPADITDGCGNSVSAVLVGSSPAPACEGVVVWTYSYTDCAGNTVNWTHTYTIDMTTPLAPAALGSSTVTCLTDATDPGAPADILDGCGNTVSAVLVGSVDAPNPIVCAGTRVWTYSYTDCAGNTVNWTYTYTIDNTAAIVPPGNTTSTVLCPTDATDPGAPANIIDPCGATIIPVLIGSSAVPACEGDVVWTYQYTDCSGNTYDWTHTYTIDMPTFAIATPNGADAIVCAANLVVPTPPAATDLCGNAVVPVMTENADPICIGDKIWTFTYTDCAGNVVVWTHTTSVNDNVPPVGTAPADVSLAGGSPPPCDPNLVTGVSDNCDPSPIVTCLPDVSDGGNCPEIITRTYHIEDACGNFIEVTQIFTIGDAIFPTASDPADINVECLALVPGENSLVVIDEWDNGATPIVTWEDDTPGGGSCPDTIIRRYRVTDDCGNYIFVTQLIIIEPTTNPVVIADGLSTVNCLADAQVIPTAPPVSDVCGNALLPVMATPADIVCEGDMAYTFTYTDCAGNASVWTYTYTVDLPIFAIATANGASTVLCPADANVQPAGPGVITDLCGNTLTPAIVNDGPQACEGDVVWTFIYTDCALNTLDWTYTYTVDMTTALTAPAMGTSTVNCPADAIDPGAPADITDGCGNTVSAVLVGSSPAPACEGDVVWTYSYTDCALNTVNWTHTYTVDMPTFAIATALGTSTVNCPADANAQPAGPGVITDLCGNVLVAAIANDGPQACEGDVVWTFTYTDCALNVVAWTHTYTIDIPAFTIPYLDDASIVNCVADAQVDPGDPGVVVDMCGNVLIPVITPPSPTGCTGVGAIWTYTYTDCALNTADWTYTYTVTLAPFAIATLPGSSTVDCPADAMVQPGDAGLVNDACGNAIIPTVATPVAVGCEGDMVWTFTYTDCAGNTLDWLYTYTVDMPTFAIATPLGASTVNCPADAMVQPADAGAITDVCGN
ncbi:MAG: PKD domain-containing protein, partial [Crocinitomicaceae bacterium]|nr:PKD domain-containing protein [Crocinitomicaceae bacterium]